MKKTKRNQVSVTFDESTFKRIETCLERYNKRDKALVVYEIVTTYIGMYERVENGRLADFVEQGALGKAPAPAMAGRRARKSA